MYLQPPRSIRDSFTTGDAAWRWNTTTQAKTLYSRDGAGKGPHAFFTVAAQQRSWEVLFLNFWAFLMAVVDVWIWKSFEFRELKAAAASGCGWSESRSGSAPRTAPPQGEFLWKKRLYSFKMSHFRYSPNTEPLISAWNIFTLSCSWSFSFALNQSGVIKSQPN